MAGLLNRPACASICDCSFFCSARIIFQPMRRRGAPAAGILRRTAVRPGIDGAACVFGARGHHCSPLPVQLAQLTLGFVLSAAVA